MDTNIDSTPTNNPVLAAKNQEFFSLCVPHRQSDVLMRINLYVLSKKQKGLPEYMANGAPLEEKLALLTELIGIVKGQEWAKLPNVPNGQATPASTGTKTTPAPAPVLVPAPKLIAPTPPTPPVTIALPVALPPVPAPVAAPTVAAPSADVAGQIAALLAKLMPQPAAPAPAAAPSLTETDVRRILRAELSDLFTKIAGALKQ